MLTVEIKWCTPLTTVGLQDGRKPAGGSAPTIYPAGLHPQNSGPVLTTLDRTAGLHGARPAQRPEGPVAD